MKLTDRLFKKEEINGDGICPTYLYRWTMLKTPWWKVYLHHFIGNDWAIDPHDHPKRFLSIGLWGGYDEDVYTFHFAHDMYTLPNMRTIQWRAPWFRSFPATHIHRIRSQHVGGAWTLCVVGKTEKDWGFFFDEWKGVRQWIPWQRYLIQHGKNRKDC